MGSTSLIGGKRVSKADIQVDTYGNMDELNSQMGYFLSLYGNILSKEYRAHLLQIQRNLFKIGGLLSFDFSQKQVFSHGFIDKKDIEILEKEIDAMQEKLLPIRGFILPGGCASAAFSHQLRCVCRRVERKMVALFERECPQEEKTCADANMAFFALGVCYINRLSDFFYVLARFLNKDQGQEEPLV